MISKIIRRSKWLIAAILLWLIYTFISIFNYPSGNLSDSADAAIVLGAAVYKSKPSPVFAERINHAINLYHSGKIQKLIFTGGIADDQNNQQNKDQDSLAESVVARDYAISKKVNPNDIFIETSSVTTHENLIYAKPILEKQNLKTVLIVSDPLHLKRAMLMSKGLNIDAKTSATPSSRYQSFKKKLPFALRELYFYHHYLLFSD